MANKKIILTISERLASLEILNAFKGNLQTMAVILEDIKQFPISDEEWKKAERKETKVGAETQWFWDDDKGDKKEIELQESTVDYLKNVIKEKDEKGEITLSSIDRALATLNKKL